MQGAIEEILSPGPGRVAPPCPHFSVCGGCTLQQLVPEAYRTFKTRILHNALAAAGFPMPDAKVHFLPAASRRRVEFKVTAEGTLGLLPLRSHLPIAIGECLILEPELQSLIAPVNDWLPMQDHAQIKSIGLTAADSGVDMVVAYRIPPSQGASELNVARLTARLPDGSLKTLRQLAPVEMRLGKHTIPLPPDAFLQATREGQHLLTQAALEATAQAKSVADLFCGIGTYSIPLSDRARVHAVEMEAAMIENLTLRHLPNLTGERRDLFKNPLTPQELRRFDAAILNPPRLGAKMQCEQLAQSKVKTIVMISCNPATFARDAKILAKDGYQLESAFGVDQFVWSAHLEIAGVFRR